MVLYGEDGCDYYGDEDQDPATWSGIPEWVRP